jgi:hypothetical protein
MEDLFESYGPSRAALTLTPRNEAVQRPATRFVSHERQRYFAVGCKAFFDDGFRRNAPFSFLFTR